MNIKVNVDYSKAKLSDGELIATFSFSEAFHKYMNDTGIKRTALARNTGVSTKTIDRYKDNMCGGNNYCKKSLVKLCVGLHLHPARIWHLFSLSHISLMPPEPDSRENELYLDFLAKAYCSDLTVEKCNEILAAAGLETLNK